MLLGWEPVGRNILPVWEAIKSKESFIFLTYVGITCVAFIHAYYTFPLRDDDLRAAVQKVLRLFFLSDLDLMDLQNVDQVLTHDTTTGTWTLGDGDNDEHLWAGIWMFTAMGVFAGPIMFMNIYIGLLSNAYDERKQIANEIFTQYRLNVVMTMLLRKEAHMS